MIISKEIKAELKAIFNELVNRKILNGKQDGMPLQQPFF